MECYEFQEGDETVNMEFEVESRAANYFASEDDEDMLSDSDSESNLADENISEVESGEFDDTPQDVEFSDT